MPTYIVAGSRAGAGSPVITDRSIPNTYMVAGVGAEVGSAGNPTLSGVAATGAVGLLDTNQRYGRISGVSATGSVGSVGTREGRLNLSGVSATGAAGSLIQPQHFVPGPGDVGTYSGDDQRGRWLAWREQQWRKKQAEKLVPVAEIEAPPVPHVHVIVRTPEPALFPRLAGSVQRLHQQMTSAGPIVPRSQIAPLAPPPPPAPTPAPPLNNMQGQLGLLHKLMTAAKTQTPST